MTSRHPAVSCACPKCQSERRTTPPPAAEEREAVAQWCSGCHEVRSVDCYRAGCPKSDTERRAAEILAAEANERARILAFIWDNYSLDGCECDHGISPPADCPNENCNARTAWAIHRAIERNEHGAGK